MANILTLIAIYVMLWWTCLFAVINMNTQSHHEAGADTSDGGDRGAPMVHGLKRKLILNTIVSAIIFVVGAAIIYSGLIPLPEIP